jgi:hypothetical protein
MESISIPQIAHFIIYHLPLPPVKKCIEKNSIKTIKTFHQMQ